MAITGTKWERPQPGLPKGNTGECYGHAFRTTSFTPAATRQSRLRGVRKTPMAKCARC